MEAGLHVVSFDWGNPAEIGPTLADLAIIAEDTGFTTFTLMDHFFQLEFIGPPSLPMLEGYATLAFAAARTEEIELGLLVSGVTYRHPGLLAKIVSTLDVLSGGRAKLGIGAAWFEREHRALGVEFPPVAERFERLEETLQICAQMWSDDDGPFEGRHYRLAETINSPQPLRRPPPILIGGGGEKKTLKLVARYAQECNLFSLGVDEVRHKLDVLAGHCEAEGRDPDTIRRTMLWGGVMPTDGPAISEFVGVMEEYRALGIEQVYVMPLGDQPRRVVEQFGAEVVPRLDELG